MVLKTDELVYIAVCSMLFLTISLWLCLQRRLRHNCSLQSQSELDLNGPIKSEVKNPEKIYATLQECRDTCGIKKTEGKQIISKIRK